VSPALRALVAGAFAHRRKTLAGSLGLAGSSRAMPPRSREQLREALTQLGHPADARAERLSPEDFRALARLLEL
jgi:16S rRNA (adenine1518-N6/adenine1519-N6)-dimethyltransferase